MATVECQSKTPSPLKNSLTEDILRPENLDKDLTATIEEQQKDIVKSNTLNQSTPNGDGIHVQRMEGGPVCAESTDGGGVTQEEGVASEVDAKEEVDGPKDILFFMRDKKSQTELREVCA